MEIGWFRACNLTSGSPRRVIGSLSKWLLRVVLSVSFAVPVVYARSAGAQVPIFADPDKVAEPEAPPPTPVSPDPAAAPLTTPLPPPPAAPVGAVLPASSAERPAPAKAAVISAREEGGDPAPTNAVEPDADVDKEARPYWYGWQTLIADGSSFATLMFGASLANGSSSSGDSSDSLVALGLLGYEVAPAIVHFVHRNPGRGFASAGLRLGMPLAGAFLGASLASACDTNRCEGGGAALGLLLGMAGAMAIDAAVFAYDARKPRERHAGLHPVFAVTPRQAWLGIGGTL